MHLSNLAMITQRVSLSIAVIAMVNGTRQPAAANASAEGPRADALQDPGRPLQERSAAVSEWEGEWAGGRRRCSDRNSVERTNFSELKLFFFAPQLNSMIKITFHGGPYNYKMEEYRGKM